MERQAPLAARLRPKSLDEVVGQRHLLAIGAPLRSLIEADRLTSLILWGPAGTGKTTIANLLAGATGRHFEPLSAVAAGVKDVREVLERARTQLAQYERRTILFLDEVHRFNRAQQDALLPGVEDGTITLVGATTENPFFEVNGPLLSRSTLFRLEPLDDEALRELIHRGTEAEGVTITEEGAEQLLEVAGGDARSMLTTLEVAAAVAATKGRRAVTADDVATACTTTTKAHGRDEHYDVVSAFIKSIRGSDPDAGLYWLVRMLTQGEDPRFIARRIVILASEDVGEADPLSLVVATAAATAMDRVGLPEAELHLAQAVVHLATAPKSNRVTTALAKAHASVSAHPRGPVPPHLRDSHYRGATKLGHGKGYKYPHDFPGGWVEQQYRPDGVVGRYYEPSPYGHERKIAERMTLSDSPADQRKGPQL